MRWWKWLPWRLVLRHVAQRQGFLDPVALLARLQSFAQPSEVGEPIELLRAGVVFHARGLINSRVIQHNLDWVWPYWIERQFDPRDPAFIPRAFSITHVNLSNRNWTAIGYPDCDALPIVDPRGLLTPMFDGWSLDGWIVGDDGRRLLPSRAKAASQRLVLEPGNRVVTMTAGDGMQLTSEAWVDAEPDPDARVGSGPACRLRLGARSPVDGWLVLALRPYNPEGISFIHEVELASTRDAWLVDGAHKVTFSRRALRHHVSDYRHGDVCIHLHDLADESAGGCELGLATAAALFPLRAGIDCEVEATVAPLEGCEAAADSGGWQGALEGVCRLQCPDPAYRFLFDAAVNSLVLHSPGDVYPGPYTYKRFWFRDAAFIIHALLCLGLVARAERAIAAFPARQTARGYFRSQEGEWDANGEVLWLLRRFCDLTGRALPGEWDDPVERGARWIQRKRLADDIDAPHAGLLPPGFSAEHLGPNDYYYWDDFWGIAGLRDAAALTGDRSPGLAGRFAADAAAFRCAVERSIGSCAGRLGRAAIPASPYRRLDAGAIGSLAAGYPLQIFPARDPRLLDTVEFLLERCFVHGAFYQDMIHSGLNAYLTLHVAQVLLRAGDPRHVDLMDAVAALASPTGQWPEAIHPQTGGGCMGDGHHVWAAAEWVLMIRNCFVREEGDRLVLCSGIPARWLEAGTPLSFGPALTAFGRVSLTVSPRANGAARIDWRGEWHGAPPPLEIRLAGFAPFRPQPGVLSTTLEPEGPR